MNILSLLLPLAWRNLWRNSRRTFIILAAISVGVWALVFFSAFLDAWVNNSLQDAIKTLTGHGQIHAQHYLDDPNVEHRLSPPSVALKTLLDSPPVVAWSQRIRVPAIVMSAYSTVPVTLVGIDPQAEHHISFIATAIHAGNYLKSTDDTGILLGHQLLERLETDLGKRVVLMSQNIEGHITERGFRIVGIFTASKAATETAFVFTGIRSAQTMLGMGQDISEITFLLPDLNQLTPFINRLHQTIPHLDVQTWTTLQPIAQALFEVSKSSIGLLTTIMFIAMAFGIVNTLLMAVFERIREFGLLQALGMRPQWILWQVLIESMLLIGIGVIMGLLLGAMTIWWVHEGIDLSRFTAAMAYWGGETILYPKLVYSDLFFIGSFIWIMGILVSLYPAWRAARYVPIEALNRAT